MFEKAASVTGMLSLVIGMTIGGPSVIAQPVDTALIDTGSANDWLTYHGSYKSYHYSPLDQINTGNVRDLAVAWIHVPGRSTRGLQSMPLAVDGVLYYTGSHSRTFALDGATGKVIWSYIPELDEALVARQTHSPYNRGAAIGEGKVFVGTVDGRLIALDMKNGAVRWTFQPFEATMYVPLAPDGFIYRHTILLTLVCQSSPQKACSSQHLYALNAATGAELWQYEGNSIADVHLSADDSRVVFQNNSSGWQDLTARFRN